MEINITPEEICDLVNYTLKIEQRVEYLRRLHNPSYDMQRIIMNQGNIISPDTWKKTLEVKK